MSDCLPHRQFSMISPIPAYAKRVVVFLPLELILKNDAQDNLHLKTILKICIREIFIYSDWSSFWYSLIGHLFLIQWHYNSKKPCGFDLKWDLHHETPPFFLPGQSLKGDSLIHLFLERVTSLCCVSILLLKFIQVNCFFYEDIKIRGGGPPLIIMVHFLLQWTCDIEFAIRNYFEIIAMVWKIFFLFFQNFIQVICFLFRNIYKKERGKGGTSLVHICPLFGSLDVWYGIWYEIIGIIF